LNDNNWDVKTQKQDEPLVDILLRDAFDVVEIYSSDQVENLEDAFSLTLVGGYSEVEGLHQLMVQHRRSYAAYLQAIRTVRLNRNETTENTTQPDGADDPFTFQGYCIIVNGRKHGLTKNGCTTV
jgi:hypothetical protein